MKLGVLTNVIGETPLKEALAYFKSLGAQMVEIGCGGYPARTTVIPACCSMTRRNQRVCQDHPGFRPGDQRPQLPRKPHPSQQGDGQAV